MKCIVVGHGSIGSRHARILDDLGCHVAVVSRHASGYPIIYRELLEAIDKEQPDYIVVANNTSEHFHTLQQLISVGYDGIVLVEKPIFNTYCALPDFKFKQLFIGYNLRFHPILNSIQNILANDNVLGVQAYVGQYLPYWRPDRDYTNCYSASKSAGGGVLRDLSHELDYINWLFGGWKRLVAQVGKYSSLNIDSDDFAYLMLEMNNCPLVNIQLNYLDRISQREIIIISEKHSIRADFVQGSLNIDGYVENFDVDRDFTYRAMHSDILTGKLKSLCTFGQGIEVLKMIEATEISMTGERWIYNNE